MQPFSTELFTRRLLTEALFYDEEYGALATVSLVDGGVLQEKYLASYLPEDDVFVVEEATDWEDADETDETVGYALAVDSKEYGRYPTPEKAAEVVLLLATEENLAPSITILFEDEV